MLLARGDHWLLSIRAPTADYAPGSLGLIGGHVEAVDAGSDVLEATARRELEEEAGVDLAGVPLRYLESTLFADGSGLQVSVTFVATAVPDVAAMLRAPDELTEVGWWTAGEAAADPRCPVWLPGLLERAELISR